MTDEEQKALVAAKIRYAKQVEGFVDSGLRGALTSREGRAVVWWLLELTHLFENPFRENALKTAFNSGELNIGLQIQARLMTLDPEGFVTMMKEKANERNRLEQSYAPDQSDPDQPGADDSAGE